MNSTELTIYVDYVGLIEAAININISLILRGLIF